MEGKEASLGDSISGFFHCTAHKLQLQLVQCLGYYGQRSTIGYSSKQEVPKVEDQAGIVAENKGGIHVGSATG